MAAEKLEPLVLNEEERNSAVAKKIAEHAMKRIDLHRRKNDDRGKDAVATAFLRGRVAEAKVFAALTSKTAPQMEADDS